MPTWAHTLDQAHISGPQLRRDYGEQRRLVAQFARAEYAAVRLLLPAPLVPDVIAATAFMHHSDNLLDQGPRRERLAALTDWDGQVRTALETGTADQPVLRTLAHTITRHPQLREHVEHYLDGAPLEVEWEGFSTESDFQRYVDAYSLPAFMLIACLLASSSSAAAYRAGCRAFIEASQRLDFLEDIAEDLHAGRLGIPHDALTLHGVTRNDLHQAHATAGVSELIRHQIAQIRPGLTMSYGLVELVEPHSRPLTRTLVALQGLRLRAVDNKGAALLRGTARPSVSAALRVLVREYRASRHQRCDQPSV
ncbi:squalene/phytoene synthase family protein [Streptomyces sp. NBC_01210]|uniref:phytoene/squalene synthase family protein n=1 Tax=Streptomyces sp. NBC_01210 TaxID=2903774 RepID=UPI002E0FDC85|nr:squalene/phytoene synthase family protein [Streptomyces sp. NBC_01210]